MPRTATSAATLDNKKHRMVAEELKSRIKNEELITPRMDIRVPKNMSMIARRKFREIVALYESADVKIVTQLDQTTLLRYCESYAVFVQCQKIINQIQDQYEKSSKIPPIDEFLKLKEVIRMRDKQSDIMNTLAGGLMLTPASRSSIALKAAKKEQAGLNKAALILGEEDD